MMMAAVDNVTDNCWPIITLEEYRDYYIQIIIYRPIENRFSCVIAISSTTSSARYYSSVISVIKLQRLKIVTRKRQMKSLFFFNYLTHIEKKVLNQDEYI